MTRGLLLEVRLGVGAPASIALLPGTMLDPTSFGRTAMWRIAAEGVLDVHGYVYFDGDSLFVQSADARYPVMVNRHRIGLAWTELRAPSSILIGQAQIDLMETDSLARSGALVAIGAPKSGMMPALPAAPEPPRGPWDASQVASLDEISAGHVEVSAAPRPAAGAPFARGAFVPASDGESTRFAPIGGGSPVGPAAAPSAPPPHAPPYNPSPPTAPSFAPPVAVPPPPRPSSRGMLDGEPLPLIGTPRDLVSAPRVAIPPATPAPPPAPTLFERAKADWYATSLPKRVLLVLSPFVLLSYFKLLFDDDGSKARKGDPAAQESAEVVASPPKPSAPLATLPPVGTFPAPPATTATLQTVAPSVAPVPTAPTAATPPTAVTTPTPTPPQPVALPTPVAPQGKTLERVAADAYTEGNLPLALQLYERLARERPENPAFAEAARIIAERLDAGR